MLKVACCFLQP